MVMFQKFVNTWKAGALREEVQKLPENVADTLSVTHV